MEREYFACKKCEKLIETGRYGKAKLYLTGENPRINRALGDYCYYCKTADGKAKKIAGKADYTGNVPKWCPRLGEEDK